MEMPPLQQLRLIANTQQTRGIDRMLFQCWASVEDGGPTLKEHRVNTPFLLESLVDPYHAAAKKPTTLCSANTTRQPNADSKLVHRRRLWPSTIQHWTVFSVGCGVSTGYKLTTI